MALDHSEATSLQKFAVAAFEAVGVDWRSHVEIDDSMRWPSEILISSGYGAEVPQLIARRARSRMRALVRMMEAEQTMWVTRLPRCCHCCNDE